MNFEWNNINNRIKTISMIKQKLLEESGKDIAFCVFSFLYDWDEDWNDFNRI